MNNCDTCFYTDVDINDEPCRSCVSTGDGTYKNWVAVDVFKNIDNHGEMMAQRQIPAPEYDPASVAFKALDVQVAGDHYKSLQIQPVQYIHANSLTYLAGNVVKYISRHKAKGGADDVRKAIHYCELILELEYGDDKAD